MAEEVSKSSQPEPKVSEEEVERILEVGRLLLSVLTPEELEELQSLGGLFPENSIPVKLSFASETGNNSVT